MAHPGGPGTQTVDLEDLVEEIRRRGIGLPVVLRFPDILEARLAEIHGAFRHAIVERLVEYGRPYHFGLEAGSKPELLAVLAMANDKEALIVCNGYIDEEYMQIALLASKVGRAIILVLDDPLELPLVVECSQKIGIRPTLGIRVRLNSAGSGHWEVSGGHRSKFGFGGRELLDAVSFLRHQDLLSGLELLHFHIGSQVSAIQAFQEALGEATRIYVGLVRQEVPLRYLDVGGGLGVDYDGTQTNFSSSMNYSLPEYANVVVGGVMEVCDPEDVPHPILVTESGRATVAHHAVLVVDVLGVRQRVFSSIPHKLPADAPPQLEYLFRAYGEIRPDNLLESYHDVLAYRDDCLSLFNQGHLSLELRGLAEDLFWAVCRKILGLALEQDDLSHELEGLKTALADIYYCNFSVFQSIPDSWAIDQVFPILPLHRLGEEPTATAVLGDITCDSDGRLDLFIGNRATKRVLELHPPDGNPYLLGVFLVGAYQEILGDLHNLFGDTNTVDISLDANGGYHLDAVIAGNTVADVLEVVRYEPRDLIERLRRTVEEAVRAGRMTLEESRQLLSTYQEGLRGYTYLEND